MNQPVTSKKRNPLIVILGIGIPSFLALLVVAGGLLFSQAHAAGTSSLSVASSSQGPSLAALNQASGGRGVDSPSVAHASTAVSMHPLSGGCWSYQTWSNDATFASNGEPPTYGFEGSDASELSLALNACDDTIQVNMTGGYDYYKIDWWRPGRNGWTEYRSGSSVSNFGNAHFGTTYEFVVDACTSHWYGDSCNAWSPRVFISTN